MNRQTEEYRVRYMPFLERAMGAVCSKSNKLHIMTEKMDEVFVHVAKYQAIMEEAMDEEDEFFDHHKIAAALCCGLLKARPINYNKDSVSATFYEDSANELCAYLFGLQVIQDRWNDKVAENIPAKEKDIYAQPIRVPLPDDPNTTYQDWFVKLIKPVSFAHLDYDNSLFGRELIFFIAHIYFSIESFSYQFHKANLRSKPE